MLKAAIKNLLGHKLRMFLTGFSIILGVSFVSGTYIFTDSIGTTFDNLLSEVFSGVDVTVRPKQADFGETATSFDSKVLDSILEVDGVSVAEAGVTGYAQFLDKEGKAIGGQGPPTLGFSWGNEEGLNPLSIADGDGRAPTAAGEVIMDKATAATNNFAVGDKVQMLLQGPAEEFTLVGIATFGSSDGLAGATLAAFELKEAQRVFGYNDSSYSEINIKAETNVTPDELKSRIDQVLPDGIESITGEQQSNEQLEEINTNLGFINTALLTFAFIAIFVGSFIIQNTFRIIVSQRSKELALLRAIGATKLQVIKLVIYEAFFTAILASGVGIMLGLVVSSGVRALMNSVGFPLPNGPLTIEPRTIIVSLSVGVIVTLLSALLPAIKASRVSPIEAMRENEANTSGNKSFFSLIKDVIFLSLAYIIPFVNSPGISPLESIRNFNSSNTGGKSLLKRGLIGLIVILIGAVSLILGLNGETSQPIYPVGFGVVLMFIGVSIIAPLLSVPFARIIGYPLTKTRGMPARLARDNAMRTPRRTASSAAALMIGVSLVTLLSILATTFKSEITSILDESFPADLSVYSENIGNAGPGSAGFSVEVYNSLKKLPELTDVTALRYQFEGAKLQDSVIFIAGVDTETFGNVVSLKETEGAYAALGNSGIVVNKRIADENGWQIGQRIEIEFAQTGAKNFALVGTFEESFDSDYLISTQTYLENFPSDDVTLIIANAADSVEVSAAKAATNEALKGYPQLLIQDQEDLFKTVTDQIDQILSLFWGLLGFAIIIAVLGITNTLMLSISERTKEIGMLRAIGMTRGQVRRMVRYESVIIALFGAILGVSMGTFFAWAVLRALASEGITGFVVPYGQLAFYFLLAIIAGILAAAWPARKAARMNILKAIYHD